jgi:hypothetical protein
MFKNIYYTYIIYLTISMLSSAERNTQKPMISRGESTYASNERFDRTNLREKTVTNINVNESSKSALITQLKNAIAIRTFLGKDFNFIYEVEFEKLHHNLLATVIILIMHKLKNKDKLLSVNYIFNYDNTLINNTFSVKLKELISKLSFTKYDSQSEINSDEEYQDTTDLKLVTKSEVPTSLSTKVEMTETELNKMKENNEREIKRKQELCDKRNVQRIRRQQAKKKRNILHDNVQRAHHKEIKNKTYNKVSVDDIKKSLQTDITSIKDMTIKKLFEDNYTDSSISKLVIEHSETSIVRNDRANKELLSISSWRNESSVEISNSRPKYYADLNKQNADFKSRRERCEQRAIGSNELVSEDFKSRRERCEQRAIGSNELVSEDFKSRRERCEQRAIGSNELVSEDFKSSKRNEELNSDNSLIWKREPVKTNKIIKINVKENEFSYTSKTESRSERNEYLEIESELTNSRNDNAYIENESILLTNLPHPTNVNKSYQSRINQTKLETNKLKKKLSEDMLKKLSLSKWR